MGEPWQQVIHLLGLNCGRETLLGALDAVAEARGARLIFFIDALNEGGGGVKLWSKHLVGFLSTVIAHRGLGVCITVRNTYLPENPSKRRLQRTRSCGRAPRLRGTRGGGR
jgi:hypothetical protein